MPGLENNIALWIAGTLGIVSVSMRLVRVYGDEMIEFGRWLKNFIAELRKLMDNQ